jgi:diguanylate cyclase (GGDEF)-like protein
MLEKLRRRTTTRLNRQTALVVLLAAVLVLVAALLGARYLDDVPRAGILVLPWWVLAAGFAATEACVFNIQVQREAKTVSLSELPLVLGLFFAAPAALLAGRLIGSAAIFLVHRRSSLLKTVFNLALVTVETAVALAVFRWADQLGGGTELATWLGAYAGPVLANCVGTLALSVVFAVYESGFHPLEVAREMVASQVAAPVVVTVGLVAVTSLSASTHSVWVLLATAVGLLLGYRAYAMLSDRHLNLERLYRFSQVVSNSPEIDEVLGNVLGEARELLRSERADIIFLAAAHGAVARVRSGGSGRMTRSEEARSAEDDWLLDAVVPDAEPLLVPRGTRDPDQRRWLAAQGAREAVVVPLRGGAGVLGVLVVLDRLGDVRTYDHDDVLLLETVANHAGVALQNGELIDKLRHEAMHDALTGLPNRTFLMRQLGAVLDDVEAGQEPGVAVMILDLDGFKAVNDTLGHQQGDVLLIEVAHRLTTAVGTSGTVARLGGDEFAVLVPGLPEEDRVVHVGRRVLQALEERIELDGMKVEVGGSLGIALAPLHATDPAGLLKRADMAMYDAKQSSRGLRVYVPDLDTHNPRRLALVGELRSALQAGALEVHVQPQARLGTGEVVSVEALVRWEHPEFGAVSPAEFIPVAERSGLIGPLTSRVLDASVAAVADWRAHGHDLGIAVNLSTRSLHDADLVDEVDRVLRRHGVPPGRLTLEITEGSVMADPARAVAVLHELRDLGCRLSVDDFGTGYSSLSYLKRLPVHEVKIDRSFVTGLHAESGDAAIVRAIVDLGRHLGLEVVAEGVEDQRTWDLLASMGCDLVQGWLLSAALPADQLVGWIEHEYRRPAAPTLRLV